MKVEHIEAIERARRHGVQPMMFAHQLMVRDLVEAALFELRNIKVPFPRLGEDDQQEVIDRLTKQAEEVVTTAISIISSRSVDTIPVTVVDAKFKAKAITVTAAIDAQDPNRHGLIDVAGKLCLLVLAPNDYAEGTDGIRAERDQRELPLSAGAIAEAMHRGHYKSEGSEPEQEDDGSIPDGPDPLWQEAVQFVMETRRPTISAIQRHLKIGYNRAARIIEGMEQIGMVSAMDSHGAREVLRAPLSDAQSGDQPDLLPDDAVDASFDPNPRPSEFAEVGKEFGDYTYEDASQLVVLHATSVDVTWLQRRLAIDSDQATTLLLRLVDNQIIELETEGEQSIDNTYKVIADIGNLCVE